MTTWAQAHADMSLLCGNYKNHTVKTTILSGVAGKGIRLRLSNQEGKKPVHILQTGLQVGNGIILPVTVGGKQETVLEPGQTAYSDMVSLQVEEGMDITVSMAFHGAATSGNQLPEAVRYSKIGNYALQAQMPRAKGKLRDTIYHMTPVIPVLSAIEVMTDQPKEIIVCFGDSITQQSHWTKPLGRMLKDTILLNKGIGGNQLLSDPAFRFSSMWGTAAIKRFRRDVLEEDGAGSVIFALGTNDIGMARDRKALEKCSGEKIMEALLKLNAQAKRSGLKTYIATVTPRGNSTGFHDWHEKERQVLNDAIRESKAFDGLLDFDSVTRDRKNPTVMDEPCDSGDHLHPSAVGGLRMAKEAYQVLESASILFDSEAGNGGSETQAQVNYLQCCISKGGAYQDSSKPGA